VVGKVSLSWTGQLCGWESFIKLDGTVVWLEKFPLIGNFITNGKISIPQDTRVTAIHAAKQQFR